MIRSYIGVVTRRGLEALYHENDHVIRFLNRRVYRQRRIGNLVWVAMDDEAADYVEQQLDLGETTTALKTVQAYAVHCGSILP